MRTQTRIMKREAPQLQVCGRYLEQSWAPRGRVGHFGSAIVRLPSSVAPAVIYSPLSAAIARRHILEHCFAEKAPLQASATDSRFAWTYCAMTALRIYFRPCAVRIMRSLARNRRSGPRYFLREFRGLAPKRSAVRFSQTSCAECLASPCGRGCRNREKAIFSHPVVKLGQLGETKSSPH
jgi:hypothetical protein